MVGPTGKIKIYQQKHFLCTEKRMKTPSKKFILSLYLSFRLDHRALLTEMGQFCFFSTIRASLKEGAEPDIKGKETS